MSAPAYPDVLHSIDHFQGARDAAAPAERLRAVRSRAARLREEMLSAAPVRFYRSFGLVRVPYPTRYAFLNALAVPTPMIHIVNRLFIVQLDVAGETKTLLISPSDVRANAETPFFKRLADGFGPLRGIGQRVLGPEIATVERCLDEAGIPPEEVDFIAYDHLHTQDLRKWLGTAGRPGYFPRARLLIARREWESAQALLPPQRDWYCPHGLDGIDPDKVVLLDGDVRLGDSVAILQTPGHTEGNQSFVVRTPEGVMVTSENGVGPDAYAPRASRIPGLRKHALATGMEVVLNGNTLERGLDQYISMVQEKEIAGPSARNPDFPNVVCSSELAAYFAFPGVKPTFSFGDLEFGSPAPRAARRGAAAGAAGAPR